MTASHSPPTVAADTAAAATSSDRVVFDRAFQAAYPALNRIAASYMGRERSGHTLQATALVSETYLRLLRDGASHWHDEGHLLGLAARSMRQVLVEHARARGAGKRGANAIHLTLGAADHIPDLVGSDADLIALSDAIDELEAADARQATVVQLRYFGGLSIDETARALQVSPATIKREWTLARLWLLRSLQRGDPGA